MRILLVDDSRCARAVTASYLLAGGHEVIEADNGQVAVAKFQDERPDLILLDVQMPVMDGHQTARCIRDLAGDRHWIPIIFLSGGVGDADVARGIDSGADDYLSKPVSPIVLRAKLNAMQRITDMRKRLLALSGELQRANQALHLLSSQDSLTQIANRRTLDAAIEQEWRRAQRERAPVAVILGDVDYFKTYNDTYGHQQGDVCLKAVAGALTQAARRSSDLVARYGGEEFAILLPDACASSALQVAQTVLDKVRALQLPHENSKVAAHVTMSLGVCVGAADGDTPASQLLATADQALYQAKKSGRDRAVCKALCEVPAVTVQDFREQV